MRTDLGWLRIYLSPNSLQCQPPLGVFLASFQRMAAGGASTPLEHACDWVATWQVPEMRILHAALAAFLDDTKELSAAAFADFLDDIGCVLVPITEASERAELEAIAAMLGSLVAAEAATTRAGTGRGR